jgi:glycine betaine/choline ABC-type transport system substrate-binding protein
MSLNEMYQDTKKERRDSAETVVYNAHAAELRSEIAALRSDIEKVSDFMKVLEGLKLVEFSEKHGRMKENYNNLVSAHNLSLAESKTVIIDIGRRLNEVETRLGINKQ